MLNNSGIKIDLKPFIVTAIANIVTTESHRKLKEAMNREFEKVVKEEAEKKDLEVNFSYVVFFGLALIKNGLYTD